jgi:hypothetical protein
MPQKMILLPTGVAVNNASDLAITLDPDSVSINKKLQIAQCCLNAMIFMEVKQLSICSRLSKSSGINVICNNSNLNIKERIFTMLR